MYYIVYVLLYAVSLLPFFIMYAISDFLALLMYHVFKYRKDVVMQNLAIAFPEKSMEELKKIARQFYHNLADTFVEIIKLISMSNKTYEKRCTGNFDIITALEKKGKNIQMHGGHQFNWEYGSLFMSKSLQTTPSYALYIPLKNVAMEKIFLKLRERFGTKFIKATEFKLKRELIFKERYALLLGADQNPGNPAAGYWQNFFSKPAPFISGPEVGGIKNNTAVVFVRSKIIKRGFYSCEYTLYTENAANTAVGDITRGFKDFLEKIIREEPHNYLWTHRRWKWDYSASFKNNWIDQRSKSPEA
jgi:Kdo2-lipid IVA lauroyltransferase/acyltransferase